MTASPGKVLITGGLGYLGGRIATHLSASEPTIPLRLMTRSAAGGRPEWTKGMDVVTADVLDGRSLDAALEGVETVLHLAAVNEVESQRDPDLALEVNGRGTYRLLQACLAKGITKFVYLSTFHVYGPGAKQPITEETPTRPIHPYAITHHLAEDYVNWHRHSHSMDTLVIRLSNGYGFPADSMVRRWTLVFNDLCLQAIEKGRIQLRSGGAQQRDFVALRDVAWGVQHFLNLPAAEWGDGLFNLGGNCSMSILQVAECVASEFRECYGRDVTITTGGPDSAEAGSPVSFSIDKLQRTGFSLIGNMSEEIRGTFEVCERLVHSRVGG